LSKLSHRSWAVIALVVLAAVALALVAGCGGSSSSTTTTTTSSPKAGGTYNFPLGSEPVGIAPLTQQESEGYHVFHEMFDGLTKYEMQPDGSMKTVSDIAESWSSSPDFKVWTFKLKQGVMFQPPVNREVTAADFVASWNTESNPANWVSGTPAYTLEPIEGADSSGAAKNGLTGVKAIDKYTLQVTLKYAFAEFPITCGHSALAVWPVDYAKQIGLKKFAQAPVGTGPFMFKKWVHNQYVDLVKNPNWWDSKANGGGPWVDAIHFPVYLELSTMWLDYQKGTIDMSQVPAGQVASSTALAKSKGWTAKAWPILSTYFICFNMRSPVVGGGAPGTGAQNLPLRQAMAYSTDRTAVINTVLEGVPLEANGLVPKGIPGSELSTLPYPYDPAKAKEIVSGLGTIPTIKYWFNTGSNHDKIAVPLQAGWKAAGINVTLSALEWGTFLTKIQQGTQSETYRLGWQADYPSMDNFLFPLIQSQASGLNMGIYYQNPQVDQLITKARGTADETQRNNTYAQAEKMALTDVAYIPIYFYREFWVNDQRVANQVFTPMATVDMWKVWVAQ
jgi:oligopeptide transport system substrate-binding protein